MVEKKIFRLVAAVMSAAALILSCSGDNDDYEFAPYKGCVWRVPYQGDTLCLELLSASDVALYTTSGAMQCAYGKYATHRGKFPFENFNAELNGVHYTLRYALFSPQLDMVLYGDSMNMACDTAAVEWCSVFYPAD